MNPSDLSVRLRGRRMKRRTKSKLLASGGILGMAALVGVVFGAGPAFAAPPALASASTSGQALSITALGTTLTGGVSSVTWDGSSLLAKAAGELTPGLTGSVSADATSSTPSASAPQTCSPLQTPSAMAPLLSLGVACGSASAALNGGALDATSSGSVASLKLLSAASALGSTVLPNSPLAGALKTVLGSLPPLPTQGLPLGNVLATVMGTASSAVSSLAQVALGPSTSSVVTNGTTTTADSTSDGVQVQLLPGAGNAGAPLAEIDVASATATATDTNGVLSSSDTPAVATIHLNLPGNPQTIALSPGQTLQILASTITLGNGSHSTTATSAAAQASGLSLDLATGVNGGVLLHLADAAASLTAGPSTQPASCTSNCSSTVPVSVQTQTQAASSPAVIAATPTAVHTGEWFAGSWPILAGLGALASGLLGWTRIRRVVIAGSSRLGGIVGTSRLGGIAGSSRLGRGQR
ncbi:MAG: hypothetical protein M1522_07930 [Actinobacteria bacterium]|nr:hypothetical protein [Actinomycetota bacterium]